MTETKLILDFFHATEHQREFGKSWLPDESEQHGQLARWCYMLKHQRGTILLTELDTAG